MTEIAINFLEVPLKTLWLVQIAVLIPTVWILCHYYKDTHTIWHVRLMGLAYIILVFIDTYTIWIEEYPVFSIKAMAMLVAFVVSDMTLVKMAIDSNRKWRDDLESTKGWRERLSETNSK